jgi:AbrB family looped-hinge helix DNA binding protein
MAWYNGIMTTTLTVDKAGRVVLPKPVRDELQLAAGDSLELESSEDQIVLRPVRRNAGMRKKMGIWVLNIDEPISAAAVNQTMREMRRERERSFLGELAGKSTPANKGRRR